MTTKARPSPEVEVVERAQGDGLQQEVISTNGSTSFGVGSSDSDSATSQPLLLQTVSPQAQGTLYLAAVSLLWGSYTPALR
jgi:hypothetical protein